MRFGLIGFAVLNNLDGLGFSDIHNCEYLGLDWCDLASSSWLIDMVLAASVVNVMFVRWRVVQLRHKFSYEVKECGSYV